MNIPRKRYLKRFFYFDDGHLSLGYGLSSTRWPRDFLRQSTPVPGIPKKADPEVCFHHSIFLIISLQVPKNFQIIGNVQIPLVILVSFIIVTLAAMGQVLVFRVIQNQVLYTQAGRHFTGVFDGGMVFFIGMENMRFSIEAEGFVKEPFTIPDIDFFPGLIRFIATAGQFTIRELQGKTELFSLRRADIEKSHVVADELACLPVSYCNEMQAVIEKSAVFRGQQGLSHRAQQGNDFLVAVDDGFAIIGPAPPGLAHHAHEPENTQKMVHMLMGDKDCPHILPAQTGLFQLLQEAVSAATIDEQALAAFIEDETRIITMGHRRISRP